MTSLQKKLAAKILKCGIDRVWIDPKNEKVKRAITRKDIRRFIKEGVIKKLPKKKKAKKKRRKRKGVGSRKGSRGARERKKEAWLRRVRPQRRLLKELKDQKKISSNDYRKLYRLVKGGMFRSRAHLLSYLKERKMIE
jgi:large subunit ribosomal protein L19e